VNDLKIDTTKVEAVLMDKTVSAYRLAKDTGISKSTIV
jgi:hypothetical protein